MLFACETGKIGNYGKKWAPEKQTNIMKKIGDQTRLELIDVFHDYTKKAQIY